HLAVGHSLQFRAGLSQGRAPCTRWSSRSRATDPRHAPSLRGAHARCLVSRRPRCRARASPALDLPRPRSRRRYVLVHRGRARAAPARHRALDARSRRCIVTTFAALLQAFFAERLVRERRVSHHTVAAYRDCFRLLFGFAKQRLSKAPSLLLLED